MKYESIDDFLKRGRDALAKGPVALIMVEDSTELATTMRHHQQAGFASVIAFMPDTFDLPPDLIETVHRIRYDMTADAALETAVNAMIEAASGQWLYYCYNAEYLFHPFCETRSVAEMLAFHAEERRDAMLTYVVDLYAADLDRYPDAVDLDTAHLDLSLIHI